MWVRRNAAAFTLIELLVVLAIASALSALVAPNLWKSYQRSSERGLVVDFGSELSALRRQLHLRGESLLLPADKLTEGDFGRGFPATPDGWVITENSEIYFLPSGVTNGGTILLAAPSGRAWALSLRQLDGKLDIAAL